MKEAKSGQQRKSRAPFIQGIQCNPCLTVLHKPPRQCADYKCYWFVDVGLWEIFTLLLLLNTLSSVPDAAVLCLEEVVR